MSNDLPNTPGAGANSSEPNSFAPPSDANFADHTRLVSQDSPSVATPNPSFGEAPTKNFATQPNNDPNSISPQNSDTPNLTPTMQMNTSANSYPNNSTPPPQQPWGVPSDATSLANSTETSQFTNQQTPSQPIAHEANSASITPGFGANANSFPPANTGTPSAISTPAGMGAPGMNNNSYVPQNSAFPGNPPYGSSAYPGMGSQFPQQAPYGAVTMPKKNNIFQDYFANLKDIKNGYMTPAFERVRGNTAYAYTVIVATIICISMVIGGIGANFVSSIGGMFSYGLGSSELASYTATVAFKTFVLAFFAMAIPLAISFAIVTYATTLLTGNSINPNGRKLSFNEAVTVVSFHLAPYLVGYIPAAILCIIPALPLLIFGLLIFDLILIPASWIGAISYYKALKHYAKLDRDITFQVGFTMLGACTVQVILFFMLYALFF